LQRIEYYLGHIFRRWKVKFYG